MNNYYTPDLEDLFVGYELQLMNIENMKPKIRKNSERFVNG